MDSTLQNNDFVSEKSSLNHNPNEETKEKSVKIQNEVSSNESELTKTLMDFDIDSLPKTPHTYSKMQRQNMVDVNSHTSTDPLILEDKKITHQKNSIMNLTHHTAKKHKKINTPSPATPDNDNISIKIKEMTEKRDNAEKILEKYENELYRLRNRKEKVAVGSQDKITNFFNLAPPMNIKVGPVPVNPHVEQNTGGPFFVRSESLFFTYANFEGRKEDLLDFLKTIQDPKIVIVGLEFHQSGKHHCHAVTVYDKPKIFYSNDAFTFNGRTPHIEVPNNLENVVNYCKKGLDFSEYHRTKPSKQNVKIKSAEELYERVINGESPALLIKNNPKFLLNYIKIKQNINCLKLDLELQSGMIFKRKCVWIAGRTGIGKSYYVRTTCPPNELYSKSPTIWWDAYTCQKTVLLDDFSDDQLGYELKIWADQYLFTAQVKYGTVIPIYTTFFVTSQKFPYQIFKDKDDIQAINRRFEFKTINSMHELVDMDMDKVLGKY